MRKQHRKALKLHTIFTIVLVLVSLVIIALAPDLLLIVSIGALVTYVAGNGLIHVKKNQLTRDIVLEYCIIGAMMLIVVVSALIR